MPLIKNKFLDQCILIGISQDIVGSVPEHHNKVNIAIKLNEIFFVS